MGAFIKLPKAAYLHGEGLPPNSADEEVAPDSTEETPLVRLALATAMDGVVQDATASAAAEPAAAELALRSASDRTLPLPGAIVAGSSAFDIIGEALTDNGAREGASASTPVIAPKSAGGENVALPAGEGIRAATALPTDPMLAQQWHLGNTGGLLDLRVRGAWDPAMGAAYTGAGVRVVVIDDGFDYNHADLAAPYNEGLDFDFDGNDLDPFGNAGDSHGTAVTGIIGADNNGTGVVGVAFDSELVGYRTHGFITDFWLQNIRDAIHHAAVSAQGDVANISQGIANDASSEWGIGYNATRFDEIETSIGDAVGQGRGGLGMTIVKSAGNSRADNYDVNADDWTNDTRQVVVAAVDQNGFVSSYSSYGAALLVSGFGTPGQVVTTDRTGAAGYNNTDFTSSFNGTSAAAPMVSGVVALIYDANASLGWRDVQSILALTARHVGSAVGGGTAGSERYTWGFNAADTWNGGGLHFSNDYGYGLVDGLAAVRLAETWLDTQAAQTNGNQFTNTLDMLNVNTVIPDGNATGTSFTGNASFNDEVERVTVRITFSTTYTADMEIYVTSPGGMVSELIDDVGGDSDFNGTWTFETQAFRGERAAGTWTVRIVDDAGGDTLSVSDIVLTTFGRSSSNDRYVFTNEYSDYDGLFGHSTTLTDTNGGTDAIHAEAVSSNSIINLNAGSNSTIDGTIMVIAGGTVIENAYGGDGADTLIGNSVGNRLLGGRGHDSLDGGGGTDSLFGGDGNDTLSQNNGGPNESMDGGAGIDTGDWSYNLFDQWVIDLAAGTAKIGATTYAALSSIENAIGGQSGDTIIGTSGANRLEGRNGNDSLDGQAGNDSLYGGDGNDTLSQNTGFGIEIMDGGAGIDTGDWSYNNFGFPWTIDLVAGTAVSSATTWATLISIENVVGTQNSDIIIGNGVNNRLDGHNGNDSIDGGSGSDSLYGGEGNDTLSQNTGGPNEIMDGGNGIDTGDWSYSFGSWTIDLVAGTAKLAATTFAQLTSIEDIVGAQGFDTILGNGVNNRLDGQDGNDTIDGGAGDDSLYGGAGNDTLSQNTGSGTEIMDGGDGIDTGDWSYSGSSWTIDLVAGTAKIGAATFAQLTSIEDIVGAQGGDTIIGNGGANHLAGQGGNDSIHGGGSGNDLLEGGEGADTLNGGGGFDTALGGNGDDYIFGVLGVPESIVGGAGADTLDTTAYTGDYLVNLTTGLTNWVGESFTELEAIISGVGNDTLLGTTGNNTILGGAGADTIAGDNGNDRLEGGTHDDTLNGGDGTDSLYGGDGDDILSQNFGGPNEVMDGGNGIDTGDWSYNSSDQWVIDLAAGTAKIGATTYAALTSIENAVGGQLGDTIIGTTGANRLDGQGGNDSLDGGNGSDSLYGGDGNDTLSQNFGGPNEVMDGGNGIDTGDWSYSSSDQWVIDLAAGTAKIGATVYAALTSIENAVGGQLGDTIIGTTAANSLDGKAGNDSLAGGDDADTLDGAAGSDTLSGGQGNDSLRGGTEDDLFLGDAGADAMDGQGGAADAVTYAASLGAVSVDLATGIGGGGDAAGDSYAGIERVIGSALADTLTAAAGASTLEGGGGNDLYLGMDQANDQAIEAPGGGADTVQALSSWTLSAEVEDLVLVGIGAHSGIGNASANRIHGNADGNFIQGDGGADTLEGNNGDDYLEGGLGNDRLVGGGGNDILDGAIGADTLEGGTGNDFYLLAAAGTVLSEAGGGGIDTVQIASDFTLGADFEVLIHGGVGFRGTGNALDNTIIGTNGADTQQGLDGNDALFSNGGADLLEGGNGSDTLNGGTGAQTLAGGQGNDLYYGVGAGDVLVEAGSGADTVAAEVDWTLAAPFEALLLLAGALNGTGNGGDNRIIGNGLDNLLNGGSGNDTLDGADGADTLQGALGNDSLVGGDGADSLNGTGGADTMVGGHGDDSYVVDSLLDVLSETGGSGIDTVFTVLSFALANGFENLTLTGGDTVSGTGNGSANTIIGNAAANLLAGGNGDDSLRGEGGADTLSGGAGADTMAGGVGSDRYVLDGLTDVVVENFGEGTDTVIIAASYTLGADVERLQLTGVSGFSGTGNSLANRLVGNDGANLLTGAAGNDTIIGDDGADTLVGGSGRDVLTGQVGADWFLFLLPTDGVDAITDFAPGSDEIAISVAGFGGGLVAGALNPANFVAHASNATTSAAGTPQFIYNNALGVLLYDLDGGGGATAVRLANLTGAPSLAVSDFVLI